MGDKIADPTACQITHGLILWFTFFTLGTEKDCLYSDILEVLTIRTIYGLSGSSRNETAPEKVL